jgi:lysylphosphatidylglycerol synthetase-like protein (DUF2156 family)
MTGAGRRGAEFQVADARLENEKSAVVTVSSAGIVAWGLYGALIVLGHPAAAVCVGIVVMLALVMREYRQGAVNIVDCTSLSFFVLALLTIVTTGHGLFSIYRTIAAWGIFAVVAWATLVAGFPFTLQHARKRAPREMWNAAAFLPMNVIVTLVWAVIFTLDTILAALALRGRYVLLLEVVIPTLTLVLGYAFNHFYPEYLRKRIDIASTNVRSGNHIGKN